MSLLGSAHPDVAATLSNMAAVALKQDKPALAHDYNQQVSRTGRRRAPRAGHGSRRGCAVIGRDADAP